MSDSKITQDQFKHIAHLSRLTINPSEEYIADQLSQAADYVDILNELNTDNTPATFQVNHKKNELRQDVITPSFTQDEALSQAPRKHNGYFVTKATISKK